MYLCSKFVYSVLITCVLVTGVALSELHANDIEFVLSDLGVQEIQKSQIHMESITLNPEKTNTSFVTTALVIPNDSKKCEFSNSFQVLNDNKAKPREETEIYRSASIHETRPGFADLEETRTPLYRTLAEPLPFFEGFEDNIIPPPGWQHIQTNPTYTWEIDDYNPHTGIFYTSCLYDPALAPQDEWLITPYLDFSGITTDIYLSFWWMMSYYWAVDPYDYYDLTVFVSTDSGDTWIPIWNEDGIGVFTSWEWYDVSFGTHVDLSAYAGEPAVLIGFQYTGTDGAQLALDDIYVYYLTDCVADSLIYAPGSWSNTTCGMGDDCALIATEDYIFEVVIRTDGYWTFSLCNSSFDTWLAVGTTCCGDEIGTNDDLCGVQSLVTVYLTAGIYYVTIEGYEACGDFTLDIYECSVTCPGGTPEPELCGEDVNGGCNMAIPAYTAISCGDTICGTAWSTDSTRDSDWYQLVLTEPKSVIWKVIAEFPVRAIIVDGNAGCDDYFIYADAIAPTCDTLEIKYSLVPGIYWLLVLPADFYTLPCTLEYVAILDCEDPCLVECPTGSVPEDEPVCGDDYVDNYNGGCNSSPPIFQTISCGDTICGKAGTYTIDDTINRRDTDWYGITLAEDRVVTWTAVAEFPVLIAIIEPITDCDSFEIVSMLSVDQCDTVSLTEFLVAGTYWFFIAPSVFRGVPCNSNYVATLECSEPCLTLCPPHGIPEPEPCGDDSNGGCNMAVPAFTNIACGDTFCGTVWSNDTLRDTDWYQLELTDPMVITWKVVAEFPLATILMESIRACDSYITVSDTSGLPCDTAMISTILDSGLYWFWVGPLPSYDLVCPYAYVAMLYCEPACTPDFVVTAPYTSPDSPMRTTCGESNDCELQTSEDHIYEVTIPNDGLWIFSLCGSSYDTKLHVGTTCCSEDIGYNDDYDCGDDGLLDVQSQINADIVAGTYYVTIEGYLEACGEYILDIYEKICTPDSVVTAPGEWTGNTCGAGNDCELVDSPFFESEDHIYEVTIPCDGEWTFSLCGSGYDTKIGVDSVCCRAELGYNDDFCGLQSQVTLDINAGIYFVIVDGFSGTCGDYVLTIKLQGEDCDNPIPITGIPFSDSGNTCCYGDDYFETCPYTFDGGVEDVVYLYSPTEDIYVEITTCNDYTGFDTKLYVYEDSCNNLLACNDDSCDISFSYSTISCLMLHAGHDYYIVVDGYSTCGDYFLEVYECSGCAVCPPFSIPEGEACYTRLNDGCDFPAESFFDVFCGDTICGTIWEDASNGSLDVDWYQFYTDTLLIVTWEIISGFDAFYGVYNGDGGCPPIDTLKETFELACSSYTYLAALDSGLYWFKIASQHGTLAQPCSNYYWFSMNCDTAAPCITDFVVTAPGVWGNSTCGAINDCDPEGQTMLAEDHIYEVEVPCDGQWTFSLCGSEYDTKLGIGTICCFIDIGYNDDFCGLQSELTVTITAGTYYVLVDGFSTNCGNYILSIFMDGENCDNPLSVDAIPFSDSGNTCCYGDDYDETCPYASVGEPPDVVYLYSPATNICVDISLCDDYTDFDTKLYVYEDSCNNLFACNDDDCGLQSALYDLYLTAGHDYYIVVDGYSSCGDYNIQITECPLCTPDFVITAPGTWTGTTCGATDDCDLRSSEDHIYEVTIPDDGTWTVSLCSSIPTWDSYIYV
ncbi:choice-of-anchor J domain-containing protein, partial [bacterium]|nr:choice-of-anchor J domain-containing protein [bacterium]